MTLLTRSNRCGKSGGTPALEACCLVRFTDYLACPTSRVVRQARTGTASCCS